MIYRMNDLPVSVKCLTWEHHLSTAACSRFMSILSWKIIIFCDMYMSVVGCLLHWALWPMATNYIVSFWHECKFILDIGLHPEVDTVDISWEHWFVAWKPLMWLYFIFYQLFMCTITHWLCVGVTSCSLRCQDSTGTEATGQHCKVFSVAETPAQSPEETFWQ